MPNEANKDIQLLVLPSETDMTAFDQQSIDSIGCQLDIEGRKTIENCIFICTWYCITVEDMISQGGFRFFHSKTILVALPRHIEYDG